MDDHLIIHTTYGKVEGQRIGKVKRFLGIPYATPPVGELRFKKTQPAKKWDGVREAKHFGPKCPQAPMKLIAANDHPQSEDCLYLNIWTQDTDEKKRPVMVWIYGGSFTFGEASIDLYDGTHFAEQGIVLVTFNYRLGILGFYDFSTMSGADGRFDTNCGIYDQIEVLKWVQENISKFGGDPDNVTIFGESAGATSVLVHLVSPLSKGLFKKAIAESAIADFCLTQTFAKKVNLLLLEHLGLTEETVGGLIEIDIKRLTDAGVWMLKKITEKFPGGFATGPVVDGVVLPKPTFDMLAEGASANIPLIIGYNRDETTVLVNHKDPWLDYVDRMFAMNGHEAKKADILSHYPGFPKKDMLHAFTRDYSFLVQSVYSADYHSKVAPVWMYRFDYESPITKLLKLKAFHGFEIPFVWHTLDSSLGVKFTRFAGKAPKKIEETMHTWWINFAKFGNPNGEKGEAWPNYDTIERKTMIINKKCKVESDPSKEVRIAWEGLRFYIQL